jgi:ABC-type multidrug transport system fused ATPase/permease subunit
MLGAAKFPGSARAPGEDGRMSEPDPSKKRRRVSLSSVRGAFASIIWPRRWLLLAGLALIAINRLSALVMPGATRYLLDDVVTGGDRDLLWLIVTVVASAIFVQAVTSFALTQLLSVEAQRLIAELRARVEEHVIHLPVGYFDRTKSGALVSRVMNDVEGVRNLVGTGLVQLIGGALTAVVALVLMLRIDATMTLIALGPALLFAVIAMAAFKYVRPIFRERRRIHSEVTGRLTESLGGVRVVKGFDAEEREHAVFVDGVERLFANVKKTLLTTSAVTSAATLLLGVVSASIMAYGGSRILDQQLTVGEFVSFTLFLGFLVAPIVSMTSIGTQITEAFAGLDRTEELLSEPREIDDPRRTVELPDVRGRIEFSDVRFAYDEGGDVLHGVSLVAEPGSVTALVGSSGSGKSTLAGLAASFLTPAGGRVTVDGVDLSTVRLSTYRRRLGVVLQDDFLFEGTLRENVLYGRPGATDAELAAAIDAAHVREFSEGFEKGLDTLIGERGVKLSGGQRQRVSIARALLADPRVLILDEATSSLDTESEAFVQESLVRLMAGRTTFVIAHRLSTIRAAHQILVLEDGQIVERGTHDDLIAAEGRYHQLYTYQARI